MPPVPRLSGSAAADAWRRAPALAAKLLARGGAVRLYATTPPPCGASQLFISDEAQRLAEHVRGLPLDGFVVYDLQDESGRNPAPRPFPYAPRVDTRGYSELLRRISGRDAICFKSIGQLSEAEWITWLAETASDYGIGLLSLAGRPVSGNTSYPMSLSRAFQLAAAHPARFMLGGVSIAERHVGKGGEIRRMFDKQAMGCSYFISQTVYDASLTLGLLESYARECRERNVEPRRIVLSFAPCGGNRTLAFMKWLGIAVPPGIEESLLAARAPLTKSVEICRSNLREILAALPNDLPSIGYCVESLSTSRAQFDASIDLFHALKEVMDERPRYASWHGHAKSDFA